MKKYNLSKIMKRAWEIKRENNENLFAICLQLAWEEARVNRVQAFLLNDKKNKVWEKHGYKRIYINNFKEFLNNKELEKVSSKTHSRKVLADLSQLLYGECKLYYDCINDKFDFTLIKTLYVENLINDAFKKIRELA